MPDNTGSTNPPTTRESILKAVRSPLGLFTLVVLSAEAVLLALVAAGLPQEASTLLVGGFVVILLIQVIAVIVIASTKPWVLNLTEAPPAPPRDPDRDKTLFNLAINLQYILEAVRADRPYGNYEHRFDQVIAALEQLDLKHSLTNLKLARERVSIPGEHAAEVQTLEDEIGAISAAL
jgi:hypothetical protein